MNEDSRAPPQDSCMMPQPAFSNVLCDIVASWVQANSAALGRATEFEAQVPQSCVFEQSVQLLQGDQMYSCWPPAQSVICPRQGGHGMMGVSAGASVARGATVEV